MRCWAKTQGGGGGAKDRWKGGMDDGDGDDAELRKPNRRGEVLGLATTK